MQAIIFSEVSVAACCPKPCTLLPLVACGCSGRKCTLLVDWISAWTYFLILQHFAWVNVKSAVVCPIGHKSCWSHCALRNRIKFPWTQTIMVLNSVAVVVAQAGRNNRLLVLLKWTVKSITLFCALCFVYFHLVLYTSKLFELVVCLCFVLHILQREVWPLPVPHIHKSVTTRLRTTVVGTEGSTSLVSLEFLHLWTYSIKASVLYWNFSPNDRHVLWAEESLLWGAHVDTILVVVNIVARDVVPVWRRRFMRTRDQVSCFRVYSFSMSRETHTHFGGISFVAWRDVTSS